MKTSRAKVDRILGIIIYLINHDNVPASYLAERFHVSVRTIQRDMVSISEIGIPVYAEGGKHGGYSILPTYKVKNSDIRAEEQQMIRKALESLATSYTNDTLKLLLEKYNALVEKEGGQKVFWDFSVTKENSQVQDANALLEHAIAEKRFMFLITETETERSRGRVWSRWQFITNGMRGICSHMMLKGSGTGHLRSHGCRICS